MERNLFHSVTLDLEKCKGCTNCIKVCPTEAIRVRNGKAHIIKERCIDCGQCIKACPHRAKQAVCDGFEDLKRFKYNIAMPAPSLYGQFNNLDDVSFVLTGLLKIGFDKVYEVASAAEMISDVTRTHYMGSAKNLPRPVISSACPACIRLIKNRFPQLLPNIISHAAPVELAAILSRNEAVSETGLPPEDIGVFFISPCPAKVTSAHVPVGLSSQVMDGAMSISDVYRRLLPAMNKLDKPEVQATAGLIGIGWALSGGEGNALLDRQYLAVDGINNVIQILEDLEDEKLPELEFIELNACTQGCVGGCLTVENPFVAKTRIKSLMRYLPVSRNKSEAAPGIEDGLDWGMPLEYTPTWQLGAETDMVSAMEKLSRINALQERLPGLDCGSCGAPSCRALAEDVIMGLAREDDCIFRMRERMQYYSGATDAENYLPPPFRTTEDKRPNGG